MNALEHEPAIVHHDLRTSDAQAAAQLLYFTSSSLTADDGTLIFIGESHGNPGLWACEIASGHVQPLTNSGQGYLKSYVNFDGQPNKGFGKASVSLDPKYRCAYFIEGRTIRCADLDRNERVL